MGQVRQIGFVAIAIFVAAASAAAVPVKPDLEKILKQQQERPMPFEPARAGWNGPESAPAGAVVRNPVYEAYGPESTQRAIRASLVAAATPDPLSFLAIGVLILFWRYTRKQRMQRERANVVSITALETMEERKAA
jgi:hypothetical protein